ncbi:MAG TPA: class III poly(R)-hydroxyalkanoic acid synthase subunit PhaC [Thiolinea sp.]|nr:class III poly(R)-hydroxyalkanoic acid synthase subunit PhaC [Thiolinea sp.]
MKDRPASLDSVAVAHEMAQFTEQLTAGLARLGRAQEPESWATPFEVVYQTGLCRLLYFPAQAPVAATATSAVPLLIVYALVNRPYMLDLQSERSFVRGLLDAGQAVYLIDWVSPCRSDRYVGLEDYILGDIHDCVMWLCDCHQVPVLNLLGVCQGGVFSLCYAALKPERVRNLVLMVTPVDFHTPDNALSRAFQQVDVDRLVAAWGNIPGELLKQVFQGLKPFRLGSEKYIDALGVLHKDATLQNFLRMEQWIGDSPDLAGEAFRQFVRDFFQANGLVRGSVFIGDQPVVLQHVTCPIFNIYGLQDHLVPPDASRALAGLTASTDYTELAFDAGHIGIYVSRKAQSIPPLIGSWLDGRQ